MTDAAPKSPRPLIRDDHAYMLPMAIFLACIAIAAHWTSLYVPMYAARALLVAVALVVLWRHYTPIRWNQWWLGIIVGVVGIVQWVGMQLWLQNHFEMFRPSGDAFNPEAAYGAGTGAFYAFVALRLAGAVLVVPVMEELFWRDWLWRTIAAPNDFKLAQVGEWDWKAFLVVAALFATVHGNWWPTAIVWALMIGGLLLYTRSLGACILAHATTNLLLGLYVLHSKDWSFW